jgi:3-methylcrotonyl-CoA carboxylase beta subunit
MAELTEAIEKAAADKLHRVLILRGARALEELRATVKKNYEEQTDIRYGAARGWVDAIIQPHETRGVLTRLPQYVSRPMPKARFHTSVVQV